MKIEVGQLSKNLIKIVQKLEMLMRSVQLLQECVRDLLGSLNQANRQGDQ